MSKFVRFTKDQAKLKQIKRIVRRWQALLRANKIHDKRDAIDWQMDLAALVGYVETRKELKFDLDTLERFGDFDFAHDMRGIERHLDRSTGSMNFCVFLPRASRPRYIEAAHEEDAA